MAKNKKPYQFWDPNAKPEKRGGKKKQVKGDKREERRDTGRNKGKSNSRNTKPETRNSKPETPKPKSSLTGPVRLNRYIAQAGVCSRREADELIKQGKIKVNGTVVTDLGTKVIPRKDEVSYQGKKLKTQQYTYILLNKPKNTLCTTEDPQGRKTVMDIISKVTTERVYPVGRLGRNTTGLLILTNDGSLAEKLTQPSKKLRKLYHVRLDKVVPEEDLNRLLAGIKLDDEIAKADKIDYVEGKTTNELGIQIQSVRNGIVSRMFEALGYKVLSLDRVMIAHLTKKQLPRGKWRTLSEKEVHFLKMI
jgi:23S rRNA pseudouridine2605 synthase